MISFNARNSTPEEIARNIIAPPYINRVAQFQNTILIGPRGIGKTTVLKALTPSGLTELSRRIDITDEIDLQKITYTPIYIPAESIWKGVAESIESLGLGSAKSDLVLNGIFTFHCLHQVVSGIETVRDLCEAEESISDLPWLFQISDIQEAKVSRLLSEYWGLSKECNSFLGMKLELSKEANNYRRAVSHLDGVATLEGLREVDLVKDLKVFLDVVSSVCGRDRWSFSFDEMEIAPSSVMAYLYENLRSFDQRAVFKFSLFPVPDFYTAEEFELKKPAGPGPGQDYDPVILSNRFKSLDLEFADRIAHRECEARGVVFADFKNYINSSRAITTRSYEKNRIKSSRNYEKIFRSAEQSGDVGVLEHLSKRNIGSTDLIRGLRGDARRAEVRKIAPIAELRSYYFRKSNFSSDTSKLLRNSAKNYGYYHGYDQILTLTEGNPRALKFFMADLFDGYLEGRASAATQNDAIPLNVDRFRALVSAQTAGVSSNDYAGSELSALEVIDALGAELAKGVLGKRFKAEPALSFEAHQTDQVMKLAIINGVNAGALVLDNGQDAQGLRFKVDGSRFRISYRLAPFFKLPTITGGSRIVSRAPSKKDAKYDQPDLLSWSEPSEYY